MSRYARIAVGDRYQHVELDRQGQFRELSAAPWLAGAPRAEWQALTGQRFGCAVEPSKIIGIGRNYRAHANELGNSVPQIPLYFSKVPSSLLAPHGTLILPPESERVDYEAELGVVIGRRARRVSAAQAMDYVFGYTVLCDVTARDLQTKDGQWTRAKGFDTFCPVGPSIVTDLDVSALSIQLRVNGTLKQDGNTRDMVFGIAELVAAVSASMTLEPGDLIATGTPEGVGPLKHGDQVTVSIQGLDDLSFGVSREHG